MRFIELSHVLEDGMAPYPGLPVPHIGAVFTHEQSRPRYQGQAEFYLGKVDMPCNVGSYLDSPFHRYPDRADLSQIPLDKVAGLPGIVIDGEVDASRAVHVRMRADDLRGRAVLVRTGWDARWGTAAYWEPGPYLSPELIEMLLRAEAPLVAVDFWNVDNTEDPARPAHTRLLGAGTLVAENLANFGALPREGFRFYAVPLRIVRGASFPVRAFAQLDSES